MSTRMKRRGSTAVTESCTAAKRLPELNGVGDRSCVRVPPSSWNVYQNDRQLCRAAVSTLHTTQADRTVAYVTRLPSSTTKLSSAVQSWTNTFCAANDGVVPPREVLQILQPTPRGSKFSKIEVAARENLQGSSREPPDLGRA